MLVFVDESGKPHPNDATLKPVLCCVCIKEENIREITQRVYALKNRYFGSNDEIKSTDLISRRTIKNNVKKNINFVNDFVDIACGYDIRVFSIIMKRPATPMIISPDHLPKQYHLLLKRVEYFCENHNYDKAMLIFDNVNPAEDARVAQGISNFLYKSKLGRQFDRILEMPLFVNSSITPAIQIADFFAGIIRHYNNSILDYNKPLTDPFEIWIDALYKKIYSKTENLIQRDAGLTEYGFYDMGDNF